MTKSAITKLWVSGVAVFFGGIVVSLVGVFVLLAFGGTFNGTPGSGDYRFTPDLGGSFWTAIGVIVTGGLGVLGGALVQLAAWIAGLSNSYALPDKAWFVVLLVTGLLGLTFPPLGFAAMVAYVVAAPDGAPYRPVSPPAGRPAPPLVPAT
jgi:hypothetical protein